MPRVIGSAVLILKVLKSVLPLIQIIDIPIKYFPNFIVLPAEGGENNKKL